MLVEESVTEAIEVVKEEPSRGTVASLGAVLAADRVAKELGFRVEHSGGNPQIQLIGDDGSIRAVKPTTTQVHALYGVMVDFVSELVETYVATSGTLCARDDRIRELESNLRDAGADFRAQDAGHREQLQAMNETAWGAGYDAGVQAGRDAERAATPKPRWGSKKHAR